jgi:signal recognition particle receptor subunit beta
MNHVPLIILANKQDSSEALSTEHITSELDLFHWPQNSYYVLPCCALTSEGLTDAFTTLAHMIRAKKKVRG